MKKILSKTLVPVITGLVILFGSCSNDSSSNNGLLLVLSNSLSSNNVKYSDYANDANCSELVRKAINYAGSSSNDVIFINTAKLVAISASEDEQKKIAEAAVNGKTIVMDRLPSEMLKRFLLSAAEKFGKDEEFRKKYYSQNISRLETVIFQADSEIFNGTVYDVMAFNQDDIILVNTSNNSIVRNSTETTTEGLKLENGTVTSYSKTTPISELTNNNEISQNNNYSQATTAELLDSAAKNLADWIAKRANESRSLTEYDLEQFRSAARGADLPSLDKYVKAQNFADDTFVASAYREGVWKAAERVQTYVSVWTACDIDNQKDYYLVATKVVCNNNQLAYSHRSSDETGAYFDHLIVEQSIKSDKQEIRDMKPVNQSGSTTYSESTSISLSGNIGLNISGPSGGLTAGVSKTSGSSRSIPDITTTNKLTSGNHAYWYFDTPGLPRKQDGGPVYDLHTGDAKDIQKQRAEFDTYAVYILPSDYGYNGGDTVELTTWLTVQLRHCCYHYEKWGWAYEDWWWHHNEEDNDKRLDFYVRKPSHSKRDYIMAYTTDQKFDPVNAQALRNTLNEYYNYDGKGWGSAVTYYAIWEKDLDKTAKEEFNRVMERLKKNKEAMNMAGFYGDFTFYVKQADSSNKLSTCTITF